MPISLNTPALLFPAITLLMLAYTNRFLSLASLVRKLYDDYTKEKNRENIIRQIRNLRNRINLIKYMQGLGVLSFLLCVVSMYCIFEDYQKAAGYFFAVSLISLIISLFLSLVEIIKSTRALEVMLSDIEHLTKGNFFTNLWKDETEETVTKD